MKVRPAADRLRSGRTAGSRVPRVLLITAYRWLQTSRLALAARDAGFEVDLLAPAGHPIAELDWVNQVGRYSALRPHQAVVRALNHHLPSLVVPVDDVSALAVFQAYTDRSLTPEGAQVIADSLGDPATFAQRHRRVALGEAARAADASCPMSWPLDDIGQLPRILDESSLPAVVKSDGSFGGHGVITVRDLTEARAAFEWLRRPPKLLSSLGRMVLDDEANYLRPALRRSRPELSVQPFLPGRPATLTAVCSKGEVLGSVALQAIQTYGEGGPATVVEAVDHPDMQTAARVVARTFGLSGFFGLDFIISPDGSSAWLLELNPRATNTAHVHFASSRPLFELLAQSLGMVTPVVTAEPLPDGPIVLFPQELVRDRNSEYLTLHPVDLPAHAPDVIDLCRRWAGAPILPIPVRVARFARAERQTRSASPSPTA